MSKNFRQHLTCENIISFILLILTGFILFLLVFPFVIADAANAQLIDIYHVAEVGEPFSEFEAKVATLPQTWIYRYSYPDSDSYSAPLQFGAKNWVLRIYTKDKKIACVKFHTDDSINDHPANAPPDKGEWNYRWEDGTWIELPSEPKK